MTQTASNHNFIKIRSLFANLLGLALAALAMISAAPPARADDAADMNFTNANFRAHFFQLCDLVAAKISKDNATAKIPKDRGKIPFFQDSYGVRALCVAYDMTGNTNYLNTCRNWAHRMIKCQNMMTPSGAYYMDYNRKPNEKTGDWYVADSSSIGMAILATSVRCDGQERERMLNSAKKFASLVINNYIKPSGGVSDGLWHKSKNEWWNSSALFASFLFNLYNNTGDEDYLNTALRVTDWVNHHDLAKKQPFPLSQQGPAMIFYVMECYSAGWPYISKDDDIKDAARAKVDWCFNWILQQEQQPIRHQWALSLHAPRALTKPEPPEKLVMQSKWAVSKGWGMKYGGLPFHQYTFSRYFSDDSYLAAGDAEMFKLEPILFADKPPKLTQLPYFMMMSYAERLSPGDIYRSKK